MRNCAQAPAVYLKRAIQIDLNLFLRANDFPRIGAPKPIVCALVLPSVLYGLLKDAVSITQTIAHSWQLHGCQRVEETGCQASESPVPQACIGLLFQKSEPIYILLLNRSLRHRIEQQIGNVVGQRAANKKFHREVVHPLRILAFVCFFGMYPSLRKDVTNGVSKRLKARSEIGCAEIHDVVKEKVALIERVVGSGKLNRTTAILLQEPRNVIRCRGDWCHRCCSCAFGTLWTRYTSCVHRIDLVLEVCLFFADCLVPNAAT